MKRFLSSLGVAVLIIVGTAVPSHGYTVVKTTSCKWVQVVANPPYMGYFCLWCYDYNWWEETFQNQKDGCKNVLIRKAYLY